MNSQDTQVDCKQGFSLCNINQNEAVKLKKKVSTRSRGLLGFLLTLYLDFFFVWQVAIRLFDFKRLMRVNDHVFLGEKLINRVMALTILLAI